MSHGVIRALELGETFLSSSSPTPVPLRRDTDPSEGLVRISGRSTSSFVSCSSGVKGPCSVCRTCDSVPRSGRSGVPRLLTSVVQELEWSRDITRVIDLQNYGCRNEWRIGQDRKGKGGW